MASVGTEGGRRRARGSERPAACLQCEPAPRPRGGGSSKSGGRGRCTGAGRLHRELGHHEHSPSASSSRACAASCPERTTFPRRPLDQLNKLRCWSTPLLPGAGTAVLHLTHLPATVTAAQACLGLEPTPHHSTAQTRGRWAHRARALTVAASALTMARGTQHTF